MLRNLYVLDLFFDVPLLLLSLFFFFFLALLLPTAFFILLVFFVLLLLSFAILVRPSILPQVGLVSVFQAFLSLLVSP